MRRSRRSRLGRLSGILHAPRPAETALFVLLAFALFVYLPLRLTFGRGLRADLASTGRAAPELLRAEVDPAGILSLPTPPYVVDHGGVEVVRNPFGYVTPTPRPRKPRPTPTPRVVVQTPTPTPAPPTPVPTPPYHTPFTLIGLLESDSRRIAVLKGEERIYIALEGWDVSFKDKDGNLSEHRVKHIGLDKIRIGPPGTPQEVTLNLKKEEGRR